jgi:hypothetical protein
VSASTRPVALCVLLAACAELPVDELSDGIIGGAVVTDTMSGVVKLAPGGFATKPICSAALVTNDWALTAGHCFAPGALPIPVVASMGLAATAGFEVVRHPTLDVAMVRLASPFAMRVAGGTSTTAFERGLVRSAPVALWGRAVQCFGFGIDNIVGADSGAGTLRTASGMPIVAAFGAELLIEPNAAGQIAAPGDSGGPCLLADSSGRQVVAGVVSVGHGEGPVTNLTAIDSVSLVAASEIRTWTSDAMTARELRLPNGHCLDVPGGDTSPGARLQGFSICHGDANQRWRMVLEPSGRYAIQSVATGLCVDIPNFATGVSPVVQWPCNGGLNQRFTVRPDAGGGVRIIASHAGGGCLGVSPATGKLEQHPCPAASVAESWTVTSFPDRGHRTIQSFANGECVDVPFGSSAPNHVVNHVPCHDGTAQEFDLRPVAGAAQVELRPRNAPGLCLDDQQLVVRQVPCSGAATQRWQLRLTGEGAHMLRSGANRCLSLAPAGTNTNVLVTAACDSTSARRWRVRWF